ncbi:MAG: T9SS type A sorting domain-containing protein [Bacteroidales bacterium]|nr:T9SS type A sorting domain-containing protein [Bacteroidales bacterium]
MAAGRFYSIALRNDSTVWTWGQNEYGQLGDGNITDSYIPVQVSGLTDVTGIAGGAFHAMAIKSDGTVVSWGRNSYGNLGDGTTTHSSIPVNVSNLINVVELAGGTNYSLALTSNDSLFAFGRNPEGQLGFGNNNDAHIPTAVDSLCPSSVGITDNSIEPEIFVFPNPSTEGIFHISNGTIVSHIVAYDMLGKIVFEDKMPETSKNIIDLSNQQSGIYILRMESNNKIYNLKLIKQ